MGIERAASLSLLAVLVVFACGDDGGGGGLGISDGAKTGVSVSMLVTRVNGATLTLKTGASVNVPPGAMKADAMLAMERPADARAVELTRSVPSRYRLASAPYVLTPHGSMFDNNVNISLPVGRTVANNKVRVAWIESESDTNWKIMEQPAISGRAATFNVQHFSVMVLVEEAEEGDVSEPSDFRARLLKKFDDCGMVERKGDFNTGWIDEEFEEDPEDHQELRCELDCWFNAPCSEFRIYGEWCEENDELPDPPALLSCFDQCIGRPTRLSCVDSDGAMVNAYICDFDPECADGSDERDCPADTYFTCADGMRIADDSRCDGYEECSNGEDEENCPAGTFFMCADGDEQPEYVECDGHEDCTDGSDERNCQGKRFDCADGSESISANEVCDAWLDCADGSDEPDRCLKLACGAQ
jgi:hypothetical protein